MRLPTHKPLCVRSLRRAHDAVTETSAARPKSEHPGLSNLSENDEDSGDEDISSGDEDSARTILYGLVSPSAAQQQTADEREKSPSDERLPKTSSRGRRLQQTSLAWLDPWADLAHQVERRRASTKKDSGVVDGTRAEPLDKMVGDYHVQNARARK